MDCLLVLDERRRAFCSVLQSANEETAACSDNQRSAANAIQDCPQRQSTKGL